MTDHEQQVLERVLSQYASNRVFVSETEREKESTDRMATDVIGLCGNNKIEYWDFYKQKVKEFEALE